MLRLFQENTYFKPFKTEEHIWESYKTTSELLSIVRNCKKQKRIWENFGSRKIQSAT